jgi:hypothetical protein
LSLDSIPHLTLFREEKEDENSQETLLVSAIPSFDSVTERTRGSDPRPRRCVFPDG